MNELIKFGSQYSPWSDVRHLGVMVCWIQTAIAKNWAFLPSSSFTSYIDSEPAMASHRKHLQKMFRIEFYASTLDWAS